MSKDELKSEIGNQYDKLIEQHKSKLKLNTSVHDSIGSLITTELPHPLTVQLSQVLEKNTQEAVDILKNVDYQFLLVESVKHEKTLEKLRLAFALSMRKCKIYGLTHLLSPRLAMKSFRRWHTEQTVIYFANVLLS